MKFERYPDWAARLNEYIRAAQEKNTEGSDVEWGTNDCCTFMAGAVEAMTGNDIFEPYRGRYKTQRGALKALKSIGAGSLLETLQAIFPEQVPVSHATQGDIAFYQQSCGVVIGRLAIFLGDGGFSYVARENLEAVFRG